MGLIPKSLIMRKFFVVATFLLLAPIAFGQTLQKGGMISVHEWTLKLNPDVTFDQFYTNWSVQIIPEMKKAIPEMKPYILKGIGVENKFAGLYYWNSKEDLGKYFNSDGSPTELGAAAAEKMMPFIEGLSRFGEFTWTEADWMILE